MRMETIKRVTTLVSMPLFRLPQSSGLQFLYGTLYRFSLHVLDTDCSRFVIVLVAAKSGITLHKRLLSTVIR